MNTNDLPPAARLAALIEAGRAANPGLRKNSRDDGIDFLCGRCACAIGFALLGAGVSRKAVRRMGTMITDAAEALGLPPSFCSRVAYFSDTRATSLDEVVHSLREGELAKLPA